MTKAFVDANGVYLMSFDGDDVEAPEGAIEVPTAPYDARQVWNSTSGEWRAAPEQIPTSVTARQFKLQLLAAGLIDQVDAWVAAQDRATKLAYEYSGTFVKSEPMMQAGFVALGFTDQQRDDFFLAASKL